MKKMDVYLSYLKVHSIPVMLFTAIVMKCIKVCYYGTKEELQFKIILFEIVVWTIATLLHAFGYYYFSYLRKLPKDDE